MNLIEGLLAALEAEHALIKSLIGNGNMSQISARLEAEKRATAIVARLTQLQPTEDKK